MNPADLPGFLFYVHVFPGVFYESVGYTGIFVILAGITLLPAVLSLLGTAVNWLLTISDWFSRIKTGRLWHRLAVAVMKKPPVFFTITLLFFLWLTAPLFHIRTFTPTMAVYRMRLLGERNWWFPKKLERFLPRVDLHE